MKAILRRNLSNTNPQELHSAKVRRKYDSKLLDRFQFMYTLGLSIALNKAAGFGFGRRKKVIDEMVKQVNDLSTYLSSNTCMDGQNNKKYDVEYNREYLKRLADKYGVHFDESIFDDEF